MNPSPDDVAEHRTDGPAEPGRSLAALADIEAWKARKRYPSTLFAGGPVFGAARERREGGWELHPYLAGLAPQDARDALAAHFRTLSRAAADGGDDGAAAEYLAAAERLDWEPLDELTVRGERFRVVRAERFIRMGPDGPEPPRRTDPDPERGRSGDAHAGEDPAAGLVVDPAPDDAAATGGVLRAELLAALRKKGSVPRDVREDSRLAGRSHPGGVLLPATFMAAEREGDGGRWRPHSTGTAATPGDARDGLALHLRVMVPWQQDLTPRQQEVYKRAADRLDEEQCDELEVAGRHFRIVRVERLIRIGPDGPEGPRPSDADPVPPAMVQEGRGRDGDPAPDGDAATAPAPGGSGSGGFEPEPDPEPASDEATAKFMALFEQERRRREHLGRDRAR